MTATVVCLAAAGMEQRGPCTVVQHRTYTGRLMPNLESVSVCSARKTKGRKKSKKKREKRKEKRKRKRKRALSIRVYLNKTPLPTKTKNSGIPIEHGGLLPRSSRRGAIICRRIDFLVSCVLTEYSSISKVASTVDINLVSA